MRFIHALPDWPTFRWDAAALAAPVAEVRHRQGVLLGRVRSLGLDLRAEAGLATLTRDALAKARVWRHLNGRGVNDRQRRVVNRLLDGFEGHLTTAKYAKIARCSHDTALRDIHELMEHLVLVRNSAGGRSTSYRLCEPASLPEG